MLANATKDYSIAIGGQSSSTADNGIAIGRNSSVSENNGCLLYTSYRNTIMKNAALARRFNEVKVNAPSPEDTFKILQGIRPLYEAHHNIELPDAVLKAAVDYSVQYIPCLLYTSTAT